MDRNTNNPTPEALDRATSARLSKLAMPVDTSRLDAMLLREFPRPRTMGSWFVGALQPMRIAAAGLAAVGVAVVVFLIVLGQPVNASAAAMRELHDSIIRGDDGAVQVRSLAEASRVLRADWPRGPDMPTNVHPDGQVMHCCVHEVGRKKMACVAMTVDGVLISMAVAPSRDVKMPDLETVHKDGVQYLTQTTSGFSMVMTERHGRWLCVMGELPVDRLLEVASGMKF